MSVINNNLLLTPEGYQISRSVRLRSSASAYLNRTPSVSGSSTTWTWSGWVKRGTLGGAGAGIFYAGVFSTSSDETGFQFRSDDTIQVFQNNGASTVLNKISSAVYRDPSAWYHLVCTFDTTNATAEDRVRLYVNGVRITSFSTNTNITQNGTTYVNSSSYGNRIFRDYTTNYLDGYLTEVNFIDGQALTPSSFGETDAVTGVWKPKKYLGTYGTNGFYLNFSDNSAATAAAIGKDSSGNGNNWTPNNISVTSGVTYDSMIDSPTMWADGGNGRGNYAVLNPLGASTTVVPTLSNANLTVAYNRTVNDSWVPASIAIPSSGKWYFEWVQTAGTVTGNPWALCGVIDVNCNRSSVTPAVSRMIIGTNGNIYSNTGGNVSYGSAGALNDIFGVAVDMDNGKIFFSKNNTWQASSDPVAGTNAAFTDLVSTGSTWVPAFYFGGDTTGTVHINFGQRPFAYTPPTGFKALNTQNLPAGSITTSGSFTGNASADGPFVYLNGVPTAMTINGNAVTFATHVDKTANGFKLRTSSSSYNASGSNTYSITTTGAKFKYANAQVNP